MQWNYWNYQIIEIYWPFSDQKYRKYSIHFHVKNNENSHFRIRMLFTEIYWHLLKFIEIIKNEKFIEIKSYWNFNFPEKCSWFITCTEFVKFNIVPVPDL